MFLRRPYLPEVLRRSTKQWKIIRSASSNQHLIISQPRQQWLSFFLQCFVTFSWAYHCLCKVVCRRIRSNMNGSYEIEFKGGGNKNNGIRGDKRRGGRKYMKLLPVPLASSPTVLPSRFMKPGPFPQRKEAENWVLPTGTMTSGW